MPLGLELVGKWVHRTLAMVSASSSHAKHNQSTGNTAANAIARSLRSACDRPSPAKISRGTGVEGRTRFSSSAYVGNPCVIDVDQSFKAASDAAMRMVHHAIDCLPQIEGS